MAVREQKKNNGITLIALIITIIILLILAGVALNTLLGDNGIITKVQKGKINYELASDIEQIQMAYSACLAANNMKPVTVQQLQAELVNNAKIDVTVFKKDLYYNYNNNVWINIDDNEDNRIKPEYISKVFRLQGRDENVSKDDFFIISYNKEFKWYCVDNKGIVKKWRPICDIFNASQGVYNSKNAHWIRYNIYAGNLTKINYNLVQAGVIYGTNKLLGADTSVSGYATTPLFSNDDLCKLLVFTDNSFSQCSNSLKYCSIDLASGGSSTLTEGWACRYMIGLGAANNGAYAGYRGYVVLQNKTTGEKQVYYSDPLYVTYNMLAD